jgi:hypothetical protein
MQIANKSAYVTAVDLLIDWKAFLQRRGQRRIKVLELRDKICEFLLWQGGFSLAFLECLDDAHSFHGEVGPVEDLRTPSR